MFPHGHFFWCIVFSNFIFDSITRVIDVTKQEIVLQHVFFPLYLSNLMDIDHVLYDDLYGTPPPSPAPSTPNADELIAPTQKPTLLIWTCNQPWWFKRALGEVCRPNVGDNYSNQWHILHLWSSLAIWPLLLYAMYRLRFVHRKDSVKTMVIVGSLAMGVQMHLWADSIAWLLQEKAEYTLMLDLVIAAVIIFREYKKWNRQTFGIGFWLRVGVVYIILALILTLAVLVFPVKEQEWSLNRRKVYAIVTLVPLPTSVVWYFIVPWGAYPQGTYPPMEKDSDASTMIDAGDKKKARA